MLISLTPTFIYFNAQIGLKFIWNTENIKIPREFLDWLSRLHDNSLYCVIKYIKIFSSNLNSIHLLICLSLSCTKIIPKNCSMTSLTRHQSVINIRNHIWNTNILVPGTTISVQNTIIWYLGKLGASLGEYLNFQIKLAM